MRPGVKIVMDKTAELARAIESLVGTRVMVGVPESQSDRPSEGPNNAELAYIHDNGAPEANIPARPFLMVGVERNKEKIDKRFLAAGRAAFKGEGASMERQFVAVGLETASAVRDVISGGIAPPLSESTLRARINRHKGRTAERRELLRRGQGLGAGPDTLAPASTDLVKPLIDTGELVHSISFAIKSVRKAA